MRGFSSWYTASSLAWLEVLMQERFAKGFKLCVGHDDTLTISWEGAPGAITLSLDGSTFVRADSHLSCAQWRGRTEGWSMALSGDLPAPGVSSLNAPLIRATLDGYHIGYDILGLVYWVLTRQEEVDRTDLDSHGRFPASSSHAFRHGYLERPIVDEWFHVLGQVMVKVWPELRFTKHHFSIEVSHDVDTPSLYGFKPWAMIGRMMGGDLFRRHDVRACLMAPLIRMSTRSALHPADPFNTFDWIMDHAEAQGLRNSFYFICGRTDLLRDADYEPEHPAIRQLMRRIHARGHEIGLHPSYASYIEPEIIIREACRLRRIAAEEGITQSQWGVRMHYLRWKQSVTLHGCADAGMDYDCTLGYADRPGFRCGTCFEYPAFDPVTGEMLPIRIRPLIAMECTVIDSIYLGLGAGDDALHKFNSLKSTCAAVGGSFTLLWHNSSLDQPELRELYSSIVQV